MKAENKMLLSLAKNDFKAKYAGSALGAIWAFINPVITILIYWFVFQVAFQNGPVNDMPYVIWLVSGVVPWFFISEGWGGATGVFIDYSYLVKKVVFKVEMLPTVRVTSAFFVHLFFVALTFLVSSAFGYFPTLLHIQVFYYMAGAYLLALSLGRITATLTVFARDVSNFVGVLVQFGFWITPIFWDINAIPSGLHFIFKINPIYYITEGYRDTFVYGIGFWEKPALTIYFWAFVSILFVIGNVIFKRLRPHLADLI
ncbi:MAG: ABC transporter permease [Clostridia bacterium]|nr:ABC transporter permease [Clostridia bacterium]